MKGKSGQLMLVSIDESVDPALSNADPKEKLLCRDCEQHINTCYEMYGTRFFKQHQKVTKTKERVVFNQFRYKEFYLYLISILWRVSVSSLRRYKHIELGEGLNNYLKYCLKENTLNINSHFKIDDYFKISVIRVVDKKNQLDDTLIKSIFFDYNCEYADTIEEGLIYYFMVDGFVIVYHFNPEESIDSLKTKRKYAQIVNGKKLVVPVSDIRNFKQFADGISMIINKAINHGKL